MSGLHPKRMRPADRSGDPVLELALQRGYLDSGETFDIPGVQGHDAANKGRLALYRAARRANVSMAAWVADDEGEQCYDQHRAVEDYCYDPQGPHMIRFKVWSRNRARAHVYDQAHGDPANLRYNPWEKPQKTRFDDQGNRL